ncbi:MAG TPA: cation:proton antiporter [Burkholderiales bacterium]|jgi:Kef-type K+ transport system membrane component KefB|nr:cation:proton antiporter [Burkholderiales bacterium]
MDEVSFLPTFPLFAANMMLVGAVLVCGLAAGHVFARYLRLPRITGFVAAGLVLGPGMLNLLDRPTLAELSIFVDFSLGLILFELGRRLDLRWLTRDGRLLASGVAESLLSFLFVYWTLRFFDVAPMYAATAAAIAVATSPAVLLMIVHDQRAKGPLTERMLTLTGLNNVIAFLVITLLFGFVHLEYKANWVRALLHPLYLIAGSAALGYLAFVVARWLARWFGKREDIQFIMLLGLIVATVGLAISYKFSVLLALLAFGVFAKNLDRNHDLMAVEFGPGGQLFLVVLFVITGAGLQLPELAVAGGLGLAFVFARLAGKLAGLAIFAPLSGLTQRKSALLGVGMVPMSAIAVVMVQGASQLYPEFGAKLSSIVLSAVVILELVGPLATQWALRLAGEIDPTAQERP